MLKELILFPNPLDAQYAKYAKSDEDKLEPLLQYLGTQRAPPVLNIVLFQICRFVTGFKLALHFRGDWHL